MTSEKPVQKSYTNDTSKFKSGWCFWLVKNLLRWIVTRHQNGISELVPQGNQWRCHKMLAVFLGQLRSKNPLNLLIKRFSSNSSMKKKNKLYTEKYGNLNVWKKHTLQQTFLLHFRPPKGIKKTNKHAVWCSCTYLYGRATTLSYWTFLGGWKISQKLNRTIRIT